MQRADRHKLILELIAERPIARQEELVGLLRDRGFSVTQASISRDLEDLGVLKLGGRYAQAPLNGSTRNLFGVSSVEPAGDNLIVVRCASGLASATAVRIDAQAIPEIIGTLAGDDTIFVAVADRTKQKAAIRKVTALFSTSE